MIESIIFIFLIIIGGLGLLASIIVLIVGLIRKSKITKIVGFGLLTIPFFSWGLIFIYYRIVVPAHYRQQENEYSGLYTVDQSNSYNTDTLSFARQTFHLTLRNDNVFELDSTPHIDFHGQGKWEAGGIDGQMVFKNDKDAILNWASPFDTDGKKEIIFNLYDKEKEVRFIKE